jgi:hypothetical protein
VTLTSITDTLPAAFTYTAGSTTGATTSDPTISGQTLTWAGPFTVPGGSLATPGTISVHFAVTVSSTPGDYFNNAGAASPVFTVVPTGDTAKITVGSAPGGRLEVRKVLSPPADPGRFNLQIDGVTQKPDAGNGDTTGTQSVTVGSHTVGETAGTATALGNYTSAISCKDQAGMGATIASSTDAGPLSVNLASGADVVCTITNTRKVSASDCEIEGKGEITAANGDEANFSLDVEAGPPPTGRLRYRDKGPHEELRLTSTAVTDVLVAGSGTEATISGTARTRAGASLNYRVDVRDLAGSDTFRIRLSTGYDSGTQQVQDGKVDIECGDDDEEDGHGEEGEHSEEATTARQANTAREGRRGE